MDELDRIRRQINDVNNRILESISERGRLVKMAAADKAGRNEPIVSEKREKEMLELVLGMNSGPFTDDAVAAIFKAIFTQSRKLAKDQFMVVNPGHD